MTRFVFSLSLCGFLLAGCLSDKKKDGATPESNESSQEENASSSSSSGSSASVDTSGDSWPQWRGPFQTGISPDTGLLSEWPEGGPERLWTYSEAGLGYSSYTVADGKLFTMGTRGADLVVIALNAETGEELWSQTVAQDDQKGYSTGWGHGPRSTPSFDSGKLYVLGPKGSLSALRADDGSVVWNKSLTGDFGGQAGGWGFSESPLIDGDRLLVAPGGNQAPLVSLDKNSGETIWKANIPDAGKAEYATVVRAQIDGKKQYVKFYQQQLVGVDAESGEMLWTAEWPQGRTAVIPTPIVDGNEIYITAGYGAGCKLVRIESGNAQTVWENREMKNHHGGVVKIGDYLYGFSDGAGLICQSWKTGELVWNEKGRYLTKGSIHAADGLLYCLNEGDGTVTLVEASPEGFTQKGQFTLEPQSDNRHPKGKVWTHPLVLNGKLYLRDQELISCFKVKG